MPTFRTPYRNIEPLFQPSDPLPTRMLLRHYRPGPMGITVYVLTDGSVTQVKPRDESTISKTYLGGYVHDIPIEEAFVLIAAGYTVTDLESGLPNTYGGLSVLTHAQLSTFTHAEIAS